MVNWLALDEPGLARAPAIDYRDGALIAGDVHSLHAWSSVLLTAPRH
jgi:hypothetical protein